MLLNDFVLTVRLTLLSEIAVWSVECPGRSEGLVKLNILLASACETVVAEVVVVIVGDTLELAVLLPGEVTLVLDE